MMTLTKSELGDLLRENLALFEIDLQSGVINWASRPLEKMFGYAVPGDLEGRSMELLIPREYNRPPDGPYWADLGLNPEPQIAGKPLSLTGKQRDGASVPVELLLFPKAVGGNRVVIGVVTDVSFRVSNTHKEGAA